MSPNLAAISRYRQQSRRPKEGGYLLLELALVLALSTILLSSQITQIMTAIDEGNSVATAKYMEKLQGGVNKYYQRHDRALKRGEPIVGFAAPLRPTIPELITANILDVGFPLRSPLGLSFQNVLALSGTCPSGPDCRVAGWATSTTGYRDGEARIRTDILTSAVTYIGLDAGMSLAESPALLTSIGGATVANPAGAVAGTLAIRIGDGSGLLPLLSQYYTLNGERPLTGDMNVNNYDINSVRNLNVIGTTKTADIEVAGDARLIATGTPGAACSSPTSVRRNSNGAGLVVCFSNQWQIVGNVVPGIVDGGTCTTGGMVGSNATGIAFVCNGSYWNSLNVAANAGDVCAPAGRTATSIANREQLVCKNGRFVRLTSLLSKNVEVSRQLVSDLTVVPKPTCDAGGTPAYSFLMTQTIVDVAVTPPRQAMYVSATDTGANWAVKLKLKDHTGAEFSANTYSITAVMKLECAY